MTPEITNLLVQAPLVGIFVWFVLRYQKNFQDYLCSQDVNFKNYLEQRNSKSEAAQESVAEALKEVATQLASNSAILARVRERVGD